MMDTALILASHGSFARGAMEAAQMIVGQQENMGILSVTEDKDLAACIAELNEILAGLDTGNGVLVLVDMFGGTPCNAASNLLLQSGVAMELLAGFNLPVLLEVCSNREEPAAELAALAKERYGAGMQDLKQILLESEESDNANQLG